MAACHVSGGARRLKVVVLALAGVLAASGWAEAPARAEGSLTGIQTTANNEVPVVVLDPGHNGQNYRNTARISRLVDIGTKKKPCNTTGTVSLGGLAEARYNWDVAVLKRRYLEAADVRVVLTRPTNEGWGPCIDERARVANRIGAAALVSIHADGGPSNGRGFVVVRPRLVRGLTDGTVEPSARLAQFMVRALAASTATSPSTYLGRNGVLVSSDYGTLNLSKVPAVIVETANMRNAADDALVRSPEFQERVARGIADAVLQYLG